MSLRALTPQTALLKLWSDDTNHDEPLINHILLIFKLHVYNSREKHRLNVMDLLTDIKVTKNTVTYRHKSNKKYRITFIFQQ